jgi:putative FmdB family regulatory protein
MPIYEYKCRRCGHLSEVWQKFSDRPLSKCEACGGRVKKIISQNTFHLKGSGWYVTDYASRSSEDGPKKKEQKETTAKVDGKNTSKKAPSNDT